MRLSAPIYRLKRQAKALARQKKIPLNEALNSVARDKGFSSWSLLAAQASSTAPSRALYARLSPGDLVILGARPGHGKTVLGLELIVEAIKSGGRGVFFTLEYSAKDVLNRLRDIGGDSLLFRDRFEFDSTDDIRADYIIDRLASAPRGTVVVIDYLQLLDQKRENPGLAVQVGALKAFADQLGLIIVFLSQIHRSYDASAKRCPDLGDVRLPNPLDLTLFDKTCFLNNGEMRIDAVS